ncbi:hypothetical protein EJD97_002053 [Solanum chilense]|uniref:Uncharacterized protein n=1 Tax=Solanum chilense TaxID=4083 RepID=A0A6N2BWZ8_SOLCI|nr:hypothetical protein EJD97_002053 [Solanum chilense]
MDNNGNSGTQTEASRNKPSKQKRDAAKRRLQKQMDMAGEKEQQQEDKQQGEVGEGTQRIGAMTSRA